MNLIFSFGKILMILSLVGYGYMVLLDPLITITFQYNMDALITRYSLFDWLKPGVYTFDWVKVIVACILVFFGFALFVPHPLPYYLCTVYLLFVSFILNNPTIEGSDPTYHENAYSRLVKIIGICGVLLYLVVNQAEWYKYMNEDPEKEEKDEKEKKIKKNK